MRAPAFNCPHSAPHGSESVLDRSRRGARRERARANLTRERVDERVHGRSARRVSSLRRNRSRERLRNLSLHARHAPRERARGVRRARAERGDRFGGRERGIRRRGGGAVDVVARDDDGGERRDTGGSPGGARNARSAGKRAERARENLDATND